MAQFEQDRAIHPHGFVAGDSVETTVRIPVPDGNVQAGTQGTLKYFLLNEAFVELETGESCWVGIDQMKKVHP